MAVNNWPYIGLLKIPQQPVAVSKIPLTAVRRLLKSFLSSVQTKKVYALANDLELEKSMFIRKRVNFCNLRQCVDGIFLFVQSFLEPLKTSTLQKVRLLLC